MNTKERLHELFRDTKHSSWESTKYHAGMFAIAFAIQDLADAIRESNIQDEPTEFIGDDI